MSTTYDGDHSYRSTGVQCQCGGEIALVDEATYQCVDCGKEPGDGDTDL